MPGTGNDPTYRKETPMPEPALTPSTNTPTEADLQAAELAHSRAQREFERLVSLLRDLEKQAAEAQRRANAALVEVLRIEQALQQQ